MIFCPRCWLYGVNMSLESIQKRKVSIVLGIGIFLFPIIFVWFLFRKGYSNAARLIGVVWLLLSFIILVIPSDKKPNTSLQKQIDTTSKQFDVTDVATNKSTVPVKNEIAIPRSISGDKGQYYLLEAKKEGSIYKVLHKRIGVDSVGYTKTQINCQTMKFREMGYSEESPEAIVDNPTIWAEIVEGSSKSDLVHFVCKK